MMFIMSLHYHYTATSVMISGLVLQETDGILISDSDLIWISHSSLTPSPGHHNLLITEQSRKFLIHQSIQKHEQFKEKPPACFHLQTQEGQTGV